MVNPSVFMPITGKISEEKLQKYNILMRVVRTGVMLTSLLVIMKVVPRENNV